MTVEERLARLERIVAIGWREHTHGSPTSSEPAVLAAFDELRDLVREVEEQYAVVVVVGPRPEPEPGS